ncbi:MAG: hypothetical protein LBQ94_06520 [Treponema sp.]|jgi:hypothetical protein|nr:hypothetical protein [Treponema sp.]
MRKKPFILISLYCFFILTGRVFGIEEKTITLGSTAAWSLMENRQGIIEVSSIRPHPVLVLSDMPPVNYDAFLDLDLSFDEGQPSRFTDSKRHYVVSVAQDLGSASAPWSRVGPGAALFNGTGYDPLVLKPGREALFAPGNHIRDFSIEFWLYPQGLETGEQILFWNSTKADGKGGYTAQNVRAVVSRNRLNWTFTDFFFSPGEASSKPISFSGPVVLTRTWSHHLVRFDADLGLLEYLVDGKSESIVYTTPSGREGGEVSTPALGQDCNFVLGSRFSGMMDNFRVYSCFVEKPAITKYPNEGGRAETRTLDLGRSTNRIIRIEAFGGRTESLQLTTPTGGVRNEYAGNSALRFQDHAEIRFYVRVSDNAYRWNDAPWIPIDPWRELPVYLRGRFIQIAADFYPGANGETTPYLSELRIIYESVEPPPPPTLVSAVAKNGAVELTWRASTARDTAGYMVYYGTAMGDYLAKDSPVDVGNRTSFRIEGLNNGTLYFFAIAAYSRLDDGVRGLYTDPGEFSREVAARPLLMAE